jgi:hypothetical protein
LESYEKGEEEKGRYLRKKEERENINVNRE